MRVLMTIGLLMAALVLYALGFQRGAGGLMVAAVFCEIAMAMVAPSPWISKFPRAKEKRLPK